MASPTSSSPPPSVAGSTSSHATAAHPKSNRDAVMKEIACHSTLVIAGWSDASSGPLIPYIQAYYGISYTIVSMLFVGQMVGFLSAGFLNTHLTERFGLGRVITLGAVIQAFGYVFLVPAFPFPVMPCCYGVIGFGMALQDAAANTFVATLPNAEQKFGYLHASYGVGALVCPLAATAFASSGNRFSYFYAISIGLALINVLTLIVAFRFNYRVEEHTELVSVAGFELTELGQDTTMGTPVDSYAGLVKAAPNNSDQVQPERTSSALKETLSNKYMWLFSLFILVYVGAEVSMGGWIVTFVIDERHGGPSAGYVATGFWGGIALGRAVLPRLNVAVGERRVVFFYVAIAIALEIAIWLSKNLIGNAVTVALVGIVMGPLYPNVMSLATKILPRSLHNSAIGFIAAFGQTGSAIFPFVTGALAQKYSTYALQPVMITLLAVMVVIWWWVPPVERKKD